MRYAILTLCHVAVLLGFSSAFASPPFISSISDRNIHANTNTGLIVFTISDSETAATSLTLSSWSSDTNLVTSSGIVFGGTSSTRSIRVTPRTNQIGATQITISVEDRDGEISEEGFLLTVTNGPPSITAIGNQVINPGITSAPITFKVSDRETISSNIVVTAISSDSTLIRSENVIFGGSGSNRNVRILPELQLGSASISLTASDVFGSTASNQFLVTLSNSSPTISILSVYNVIALNATSAPLPFKIGDLETPASNLVLSAMSSDPDRLPNGNVILEGITTNRTITILPPLGSAGTCEVSVVVSDYFNASATNKLKLSISQFVDVTNTLPGYDYSSSAWGDYDGDGHLDVAIIGLGPSSPGIFHNNGDGSFSGIGVNLMVTQVGALTWNDYDCDGDLDLTVAGAVAGTTNIARLFRNDGLGSFTILNPGLPAVRYCALAWGDYDNDGDPDLLIAGNSNDVPVTQLFRNDNGLLTDSGVALPALLSCSIAWGDYDNDGDLDLFMTGLNFDYSYQGRVYRNAGNGKFQNIFVPILEGLAAGSTQWGDYDADGDLDILIHGAKSQGSGYTEVYRNDGLDVFFKADVGSLPGGRIGAVWADYDNDGKLDLTLGLRSSGFAQHFFGNSGGVFTKSGSHIFGLGQGSLAWGDYNNDGLIDLIQTGQGPSGLTTRLYRNSGITTNTSPTAPAGLLSVVNGRLVRLAWQPSNDANQSNALTYNLRVGTAPNSGNIMTPMALSNGQRQIPASGNVFHNTNWFLQNLNPGLYFWSVQAVDHGFQGSPFAAEGTFVISAPPGLPSAITEAITGITFSDAILHGIANANGLASQSWFEYGVTTNYGLQSDIVALPAHTNDFPLDLPIKNLTAATKYHVRLVCANNSGTNFGLDRTFVTPAFTPFSAMPIPLPDLNAIHNLWGDTDNDGDLDLFLFGNKGEMFSSFEARLWRNDNGTFVKTSLLTNGNSIMSWQDFNRDNRIDLISYTNLFQNSGTNSFLKIPLQFSLPFGTESTAQLAWGDFDNDGDSDALATRAYYAWTILLTNENGIFKESPSGLPHATDGAANWLDYDGDGRLDLFLSRFAFGEACAIYQNKGDGSYTNLAGPLQGANGGSVAWGDINDDGTLDLLVGSSGYYGGPTKLFFNNNSLMIDSGLTNLPSSSRISLMDFDNDGLLDLLAAGPLGNDHVGLRLFRNEGSSFSEIQTLASCVGTISFSHADYDEDGDLDILASGTLEGRTAFVRIFRNNCSSPNSLPSAPTNLTSSRNDRTNVLSWIRSTDLNQINGFSYNLRVGTMPGGSDVLSPMADTSTGYRLVPRFGNAGVGTNWLLCNLRVGTYYWSVQAIDHSFAGSPFAPEASFVIPPRSPDVLGAWSTNATLIDATLNATVNPNGLPTVLYFEYGLTTNYSVISQSTPTGDSTSNVTANVFVTGLSPLTTYHYRAVASNQLGVAFGPDQTFTTFQFTQIPGPMNHVKYSGYSGDHNVAPVWGDFNGDGKLDLIVQGVLNGYYTRLLFTNDGAGNFTEINSGLPGGGIGLVAIDLNRDGDLDLLIPGTTRPIYNNNGNGFFSNDLNFSVGFPSEHIAPADFDNDGDTDFLVTGQSNSVRMTRLFANNGNGGFTNSPFNFTGASPAMAAWGDFDNDSDLDLALTGQASGNSNFFKLYRNDGQLGFSLNTNQFIPVLYGRIVWEDYDNDGDVDLALAGYSSTLNIRVTRIYRNDDNNNFAQLNLEFPNLDSASASWGDYDNNGLLDILLTGNTNYYSPATLLYQNLGGDNFSIVSSGLAPVAKGGGVWGDYDGDGDLDIALAGDNQPVRIYRNNNLISNTVALSPTGLNASSIEGALEFSWTAASDGNQPTGLTYNLRVGTAPGSSDILNPMASVNGRRNLPQSGNVEGNLRWVITNLPPRTYYWSVQAIDSSFAGSPFAQEMSAIRNRPPVVDIQSLSLAEDTMRSLSLTGSDGDNQSLAFNLVTHPTNGVLSGNVPNLIYWPKSNYFGLDSFTFRANDSLANSTNGLVTLTITPVSDVSSVVIRESGFSNGSLQGTLSGEPYAGYSIETSEDLLNWSILTNLFSTNGLLHYSDSPLDGYERRFYRAKQLP